MFFTSNNTLPQNPHIEEITQVEETENKIPVVKTTTPETFDSLLGTVTALKNRYPDIIKVHTAGYSESGKEILMYTLGNGNKKALITGAIHAREHITTKYLLKVTEDYCNAYYSATGYYGNYDIYNLLNEQKERGVAVIFVGEDLDVLMDLCDRILVINSGKVTGIVDGRTAKKDELGMLMVKSTSAEENETEGEN